MSLLMRRPCKRDSDWLDWICIYQLSKTGCRMLTFVLTFRGGEISNLYRSVSEDIDIVSPARSGHAAECS